MTRRSPTPPSPGAGVHGREAFVWALLCFGVLFLLLRDRPFDLGDEGFQYLLSRSWSAGDSLYERFRVIYPTGQYAYFGSWMRLLGEELWVLRLGQAALLAAAVGLLHAAVRPATASPWPAALVAVGTVFSGAKPVTTFAAGLVVLAAGRLALALADRPEPAGSSGAPRRDPPVGPGFVVATALAAGALAGFREDSAVLLLAVALVAVACRRRPRELVTLVAPAAAGGFLAWLAVAGLRGEAGAFAAHAAHRLAFLVERLGDPTEVASTAVRMPRNPHHLGRMALPVLAPLPLLVYTGVGAVAALRWRRGRPDPVLVAACLLGFAYLPQFLWERPGLGHFKTHLPILLTVMALAAGRLAGLRRRLAVGALALVVAVTVGAVVTQRALSDPLPYPSRSAADLGIHLAAGAPEWAGLDRRPGETMISLGWGPGWYAVEGLPPGSRHLSTFPRHLDAAARRELIRDLERPSNRYVILSDRILPPPPAEVLRAMEAEYHRVGRFGGDSLWERRTATEASP